MARPSSLKSLPRSKCIVVWLENRATTGLVVSVEAYCVALSLASTLSEATYNGIGDDPNELSKQFVAFSISPGVSTSLTKKTMRKEHRSRGGYPVLCRICRSQTIISSRMVPLLSPKGYLSNSTVLRAMASMLATSILLGTCNSLFRLLSTLG
jgi:hypothetical protein